MKNIKTLFLSFIAISLFSCEDATDINQPGRLIAENAFQSINDLQLGLLGAYNSLDITYDMALNSRLTDEIHFGTVNGGQASDLLNFVVTPETTEVQNIWLSNYTTIGRANRIIAAAATISRDDDPVAYDDILGQAYALRAYCHFQILTYFSPDYTDVNALAGILVDFVPTDVFTELPRSTNGEFYTLIESDLTSAENLITTDLGNKFVGQNFINALRARMFAYRQMYTQADAFAADLLTTFPIADQAQYTAMFTDTDFTEVIFSLERTIGDSYDGQGTDGGGYAGSIFSFQSAESDGGIFLEMGRATFNILNGTPDIRFSRNINLAESTINPAYNTDPNYLNSDVLIPFKYPGSDNQPLMNDLKVFRSSEMLLIRAEAAAAASDFTAAATFIDQLRDARFGSDQPSPFYSNQTEAFGAILDERRIELLFEGHRWVDIKRLGNRGNRSIDRDTYECSFLAGCTLPTTDYRFTLPIPRVELSGNTVIRDQQNTGY